jgi:hypothetical protein
MRVRIVTALLICAALSAEACGAGHAGQAGHADVGADEAIYWGGTIHGETYGLPEGAPENQQVWNLFERHAGKKVTFINVGQPWGTFDSAPLRALLDRGALPLVTTSMYDATLADVAAGREDREIREWARQAKAWGYPFLFRPWWEMNGDWYPWGRDPKFVAAWRHFHDLVVAEGATNVTWAWIVNAIWWDPASDPGPYYPGDEYVDWVGMDAYNYGRNPIQPDRWASPDELVDPTLERLEQIAPGKPVCICETASTEIGGNKAAWIRNLLMNYLPHHRQIKAFLWFNWNVQRTSGRWDWAIESSSPANLAFRRSIQSSFYRTTLPTIMPLAKVPMP